ncbi:hypothetical protein ABPG72_013484 [Tetrahymena utriculariae]
MTTLGYWGFRGLAQPIRLLLAYLGIQYTNKAYYTPEEWFGNDKNELGLDFPNIPYLIDGEIKLTESSAIPIYLIRKHKRNDLLGFSDDGSYSEKEVRVAQLVGVIKDLFKELTGLCFNPDFKNIKDKLYTDKIEIMVKRLVAYLGDKEFLLGTLTFADFIFYEALSYIRHIYPQANIYATLTAYLNRFENLPGIKEYLANPDQNLKIFLPPNKAAWFGPQ